MTGGVEWSGRISCTKSRRHYLEGGREGWGDLPEGGGVVDGREKGWEEASDGNQGILAGKSGGVPTTKMDPGDLPQRPFMKLR